MNDYFLYLIAITAFAVLVISLEWEKIKKIDLKTIFAILVILFFLGSSVVRLFT